MGREQIAIINASQRLGVEWIASLEAKEGLAPVGCVEFCEPVFGVQPEIKDFYPSFLSEYRTRLTYITGGGHCLPYNRFVKCATKWKCDQMSQILQAGTILFSGLWLVSSIVHFVQEWRYYVADGELITTGWYDGIDEDEPAPEIDVDWPAGFSGAVDFGRLDNGRIELVETHAPFGCGWYGEDPELFAIWQAVAWEHRKWWLA